MDTVLETGYVVLERGIPHDFKPMRLSELYRRATDGGDGYTRTSVERAAKTRYDDGLCIECGVLAPDGSDAVCGPCRAYIDGVSDG